MNLLSAETNWYFLSGSDEDRFLMDIDFGVRCLQYRGFPESNIKLFIDQPSPQGFLQSYNFPGNLAIYPTAQLERELNSATPQQLVIVVTGHGDYGGITASPPIKPYQMLQALRSTNGLEKVLMVLGQCYAGLFNFLEARSYDNQTGQKLHPEICIIGATGLNTSISFTFEGSIVQHIQFPTRWLANLFLLSFMIQVSQPIDIDGDGLYTAMDAFKFAGIYTNIILQQIKHNAFMEVSNVLVQRPPQQTQSPISLDQQSLDKLKDLYSNVLISQDYWILNANFARELIL